MTEFANSFGGRALDRFMTDYEAVLDAPVSQANVRESSETPYAAVAARLDPALDGGAPAEEAQTPIQQALAPQREAVAEVAEPAETVAAPEDPYAEPAAPETAPAPESDVEPAWVAALREQNAQQAQALLALAERVQAPAQAEPEPDLDLMGADELRAYIDTQRQAAAAEAVEAIRGELAPFTDLLGQVAQRESREAAEAYYSELEQNQVGRFDHDQAHLVAFALVQQGTDPVAAMAQAAQMQHAFEARLWRQFSDLRAQAATNVVTAPAERPAAAATATEIVPVATGANRYEDAAAQFMARRQPQAVIA